MEVMELHSYYRIVLPQHVDRIAREQPRSASRHGAQAPEMTHVEPGDAAPRSTVRCLSPARALDPETSMPEGPKFRAKRVHPPPIGRVMQKISLFGPCTPPILPPPSRQLVGNSQHEDGSASTSNRIERASSSPPGLNVPETIKRRPARSVSVWLITETPHLEQPRRTWRPLAFARNVE